MSEDRGAFRLALDLTKPVQTRDGRKVRILCTDRLTMYTKHLCVHGLVTEHGGAHEFPETWSKEGRVLSLREHDLDLINVPPPLVPHVHAELIKAWADGAKIQVRRYGEVAWFDTIDPTWDPSRFYRIAP
jgi:hypothetical protein